MEDFCDSADSSKKELLLTVDVVFPSIAATLCNLSFISRLRFSDHCAALDVRTDANMKHICILLIVTGTCITCDLQVFLVPM